MTTNARITQIAGEVLRGDDASKGRVTQIAAEILRGDDLSKGRITQIAIEVLRSHYLFVPPVPLDYTRFFWIANLLKITPVGGSPVFRTDFDVDISYNGDTYLHLGLVCRKGQLSWKNDLSVDQLDFTFAPSDDFVLGTIPFMDALKNGEWDAADVEVHRAFLIPDTTIFKRPAVSDVYPLFFGRIGDVQDMDGMQAKVTINSHLELLNMEVPRRVYEPSCSYILFDGGCGVDPASSYNGILFTNDGVVTADHGAGGPTVNIIPVDLTEPADFYTLGKITFLNGENAGLTRTIGSWDGSTLTVYEPFPKVPEIGDQVRLVAGCNKTMDDCINKFGNLIGPGEENPGSGNYGGEPFIPVVETAY